MNTARPRYPTHTFSGAAQPQYRSFLNADDGGSDTDTQSITDVALPIAKALLDESAIKDVEVLRAKVVNAKAIRDRFPKGSLLWTTYDNRFRVLAAKLKAAKVEKKQESEDRQSKQELVTLGKTGIIVGIVGGAALVALLVNLAGAAGRHGRQ